MSDTKLLLKEAEQVVYQWDNHDKFRGVEWDKTTTEEPKSVAIARAFIDSQSKIEELVKQIEKEKKSRLEAS